MGAITENAAAGMALIGNISLIRIGALEP